MWSPYIDTEFREGIVYPQSRGASNLYLGAIETEVRNGGYLNGVESGTGAEIEL